MFEESLVESTPMLRARNRWPAVASFAVQAVIATAIVAIPLMHPEIMPLHLPLMSLTPPVPIPPTPPVVVERVTMDDTASNGSSVPRLETSGHSSRPQLDQTTFGNEPPTTSNIGVMTSGNDALNMLANTSATGSHVSVVPAARPGPPLRLSTGISAGLLLAPITPVYPRIAVAIRQSGTVVVHAIISKAGNIESANVVSGPVMLQSAALDAVRLARYRPYLLNGEPTEVETTFNINFRLNDQ